MGINKTKNIFILSGISLKTFMNSFILRLFIGCSFTQIKHIKFPRLSRLDLWGRASLIHRVAVPLPPREGRRIPRQSYFRYRYSYYSREALLKRSFSVRSTPAKRSFTPAQPLFPNLSHFPFPLSLRQRRYSFLTTVHCPLRPTAPQAFNRSAFCSAFPFALGWGSGDSQRGKEVLNYRISLYIFF